MLSAHFEEFDMQRNYKIMAPKENVKKIITNPHKSFFSVFNDNL